MFLSGGVVEPGLEVLNQAGPEFSVTQAATV
jgi:hypothetical protein